MNFTTTKKNTLIRDLYLNYLLRLWSFKTINTFQVIFLLYGYYSFSILSEWINDLNKILKCYL